MGSSVQEETVLVMAGITKIYCAEILERAKAVMVERGEEGQIKKPHLFEAYRRMQRDGCIPYHKNKRQLFRFS